MNKRKIPADSRKKVLSLCYYPLYPVNFGTAVRNYQIFKHLSKRYKIHVVCPSCEGYENNIDIVLTDAARGGLKGWVFDFRLLHSLLKMIRKDHVELVFLRDMRCGFYGILLHLLTGVPLYLDEHNVEFIRLRRTGKRYWRMLKIFEMAICRMSKRVFCVSEHDRKLIMEDLGIYGDKVQAIENGFEFDIGKYQDLDLEKIRVSAGIEAGEKAILFFGNLYYEPNVEGVRIIFDEIVPKIEGNIGFKIWVLGKGDAQRVSGGRSHPKVMFLGEQPDVYPYIMASDLVIVPLTSGGGTRVKIIESIATGKRVLSTSLGAEGIERNMLKENLFIEDDWDRFAKQLIELTQCSQDDVKVQESFVRRYGWAEIVQKIVF